ncbi:hypothetical protein AVEN_125473-1 [Araneus ventricosus]|uniref:Uncharacterized protein n=1 Tax=Araneus ventricosus TaxID=182803 RepID=A0A4Y2KS43_ARAVE|nr:hypothetical protein AVEN_125473-1 [Araneus ventricosus]
MTGRIGDRDVSIPAFTSRWGNPSLLKQDLTDRSGTVSFPPPPLPGRVKFISSSSLTKSKSGDGERFSPLRFSPEKQRWRSVCFRSLHCEGVKSISFRRGDRAEIGSQDISFPSLPVVFCLHGYLDIMIRKFQASFIENTDGQYGVQYSTTSNVGVDQIIPSWLDAEMCVLEYRFGVVTSRRSMQAEHHYARRNHRYLSGIEAWIVKIR